MKIVAAVAVKLWLVALLIAVAGAAQAQARYEGHKKCGSCHRSQAESWRNTKHAQAMKSLEPNARAEAKRKASLDPAKDYTADKDCVGCHVTGFEREGGYRIGARNLDLDSVACESCHGPGRQYRLLHRKAGQAFESERKTTPRQQLAEAGEEKEFRERCNACHLNYEGSPWTGARKPYTPFTPKVDPKYAFDFDKALDDDKAVHEHFKLEGVFTGPPLPPFRDRLQARAQPGVMGKE